jgi:hypothetical protein
VRKRRADGGIPIMWRNALEPEPSQLSGPASEATSSRSVDSPNGKPHLMAACGAIVHPNTRVASLRKSLDACNSHFFPAPAVRQFGTAGH